MTCKSQTYSRQTYAVGFSTNVRCPSRSGMPATSSPGGPPTIVKFRAGMLCAEWIRLRVRGSEGSPTMATSNGGASERSATDSILPNAGPNRIRASPSLSKLDRASSLYRRLSNTYPARIRSSEAREAPDGVALSKGSLGRNINVSPSLGVS